MQTNIYSSEVSSRKKQSQTMIVLKRLMENPAAIIGLCIILVMILASILAPWISPYAFDEVDLSRSYLGPCKEHLFGTDQLGRDIFSRVLYGGRFSLTIGICATLIGSVVGIMLGSISGFFGGVVDDIVMRLCDVVQSIPGMILNVALSCVLGEGFFNCILALSIGGIAGSARMMRASILSVRKLEYIEAAGVINCSYARTIIKHVLPNAISPCIVSATMGVGGQIMAASSLAYLGFGVRPPIPEWGAMLTEGRNYITKFPYMTICPGIVIVITVLALNLLGDGLRDALDPKLKK